MKIYIDISHIVNWEGRLTGIERVEYHIIKYFYEKKTAEFICWNGTEFEVVGRTFVDAKIIHRSTEVVQAVSQKAHNQALLHKIKKRLKKQVAKSELGERGTIIVLAGLWDNTSYANALVDVANTHSVVHVVYDMIPLVQKAYVVDFLPAVFEKYMLQVLPACSAIFSDSASTAKDTKSVLLENSLQVPKIEVFRLGDDITRAKNPVRPKNIEGEFILSVGTIEARKNHQLLYYVYKLLKAQNIKQLPKIIIVGKRGWLSSDFLYMAEHDTEAKDGIIILDSITDAELCWLYENCLFTVFPSFYEGWGLPLAESLQYGKVTLSSGTSSLPEVGGGNVDYFSPFSTDELSALIHKYLDKPERTKREAAIKKSYCPTSWDESVNLFEEKLKKAKLI